MFDMHPAKLEDAEWLFELRNDPEAYKNFFNPNLVAWEEHMTWLNKVFAGKECFIYIITNNEKEKVGMVKFNIDGVEAEIGINVAKNFRGQGYGEKIIRLGSDYFFEHFKEIKKIIASIKESNPGSIKVFSNAGYQLMKTEDGVLRFELNSL